MNQFKLSEAQATAILEMRLRRLTGLERSKIENELAELLEKIKYYNEILASEEKVLEIIKTELLEIKNKYSDERRTSIDMTAIDFIEDESLIPVENIIITLTKNGYIKRMNEDVYKTQNRGGVGIKGMTTNEEDIAEYLISMTSHDYILFFTDKGKVYRIKGYEVPEYSRQSKGLPIINLLPIEKDENVTAMLSIENNDENKYIVFCTQSGLIKKTLISEFDSIRKNGKIAITLKEDDKLISVNKTDGNKKIMIGSSLGRMVRFDESEIRILGRTASGVRGINVGDGICVGCEIADDGQKVLVVTENGYGKQTDVEEYRQTHRGSKGVKALNVTEKNGNIVSFKIIDGHEDLMIITNSGMIIRLPIDQISSTGRVAQGVKLINLKDGQLVGSIVIINSDDTSENDVPRETSENNEPTE